MHDKRIQQIAERDRIRAGELVGVRVMIRSIASVFQIVQIGLICAIGISERRDRFNDYHWCAKHRFSKPHNRNDARTNSIATVLPQSLQSRASRAERSQSRAFPGRAEPGNEKL